MLNLSSQNTNITVNHDDNDCNDEAEAKQRNYSAYPQHLKQTISKVLHQKIAKNRTQTLTIDYVASVGLFSELDVFKKPKMNKHGQQR